MLSRVLVTASFVLILASQQVLAKGIPSGVKAALNKLVGEWDMETVVDGTTTHMDIEIKRTLFVTASGPTSALSKL